MPHLPALLAAALVAALAAAASASRTSSPTDTPAAARTRSRSPSPAPVSALVFSYSGDYATWRVPPGVTAVTLHAWGAGGGGGFPGYGPSTDSFGGAGAYANGSLAVVPGETLRIIVGKRGEYNGAAGRASQGNGGSGAPRVALTSQAGGSGGGRTAVQRVVDGRWVDIVTVGGGGGGGGASSHGGPGGAGAGRRGGDLAFQTDVATGATAAGRPVYFGGGGSATRAGRAHFSGGDGAAYRGGDAVNAPDVRSGGGGGGFFGGGAGSGGAGGGGSSNLRALSGARGETARGAAPPGSGSRFFTSDTAFGGTALRDGGHGRLVLTFRAASSPAVSNAATASPEAQSPPATASRGVSPTRSSKGRLSGLA